jgi:hypothetical protein
MDLNALRKQPLAAMTTATGKNRATILGLHARTKTELLLAGPLGGLIGAFHNVLTAS